MTPSRGLLARTLAAALLVWMVSASGAADAAPSAPVPHVGVALPTAYDPIANYEAQATCDPRPKPGAVKLAALIRRTYGAGQTVSISRGCGIGGVSEHKEGRAVDWMTSVRTRTGKANAEAFLAWLVGPDEAGVPFGHAIRLGVMYVGWNDRYWASYAPDRGWAELKGCLSRPGAGNDTICHRNHVHISLSWDGASGRTSLWDGTALTPYCGASWSSPALASVGRVADPVAVTPVVVLSTREGRGIVTASEGWSDPQGWHGDLREDVIDPGVDPTAGPTPDPADEPTPVPDPSVPPAATPAPSESPAVTPTATPTATPLPGPACRVHPSGWGHERSGVRTQVLGQGDVPPTGVAAVVVKVTALGATAPSAVGVWSGDTATAVLDVRMNGRGSGAAIVPVADDGTIAFSTTAGATDLRVAVTGYFTVGDQPNETVVLTGR